MVDRQKELDLIQSLRELLSDAAAGRSFAAWWDQNVPDSIKLAQQQATWDAMASMPTVAGRGPQLRSGRDQQECHALFLAAIARCLATRCPHAGPITGRAMYAFLAPRVLTCHGCIPTFRPVFERHDAERPRADECDLCLALGVKNFFQFSLAFSGAILTGDACPACVELMNGR